MLNDLSFIGFIIVNMPKKLILIAIMLAANVVFAGDPCQSTSGPYGPMICGGGVTNSVYSNGSVSMQDTIVRQATQINGQLLAEKVVFNTLTVNGKVSLQHSVVQGEANLSGFMSAFKTTFGDTLNIASNYLKLSACHTADIIVSASGDGVSGTQTIDLTDSSLVDGDITFKANDGVVNLGPNSKITGKVLGGKIVRQTVKTNAKKSA